jgi:hypothetical protein
MAFGLTARYDMLSYNTEQQITGFRGDYADGDDRSDNFTEGDTLDSLRLPESGNRIDVELKMFWDWADYAEGRFYVGYFMQSVDYGSDAVAYNWGAETQDYTFEQYDTSYTISWYDGGHSVNGIRVGTKQLFTVSDRLLFGFGFFWATRSYDDSTTQRDTSVVARRYEYNDTLFTDYNTWTYSSETWATEVSGSVNTFTIPVGVEFYVAQPVVFRMGAQHSITKNDLTTTRTLTDWEPEVMHYRDDANTEYWTYTGPGNRPENSEVTDTELIPATSYYYGLGWQVNRNLQIDLMSFNDITDMTNWRLSATLHFD